MFYKQKGIYPLRLQATCEDPTNLLHLVAAKKLYLEKKRLFLAYSLFMQPTLDCPQARVKCTARSSPPLHGGSSAHQKAFKKNRR
jgi:hypothetical protein